MKKEVIFVFLMLIISLIFFFPYANAAPKQCNDGIDNDCFNGIDDGIVCECAGTSTSNYCNQFDGLKDEPYIEEDKPNPLNHYGFTKLIGERMIQEAMSKYYIFRITWLYGKYRKNFVKTILKLASEKDELKIVNDQTGCPTYTKDVINAVDEAIKQNKNKFGIYHLNNSDSCSWFEFANEILDIKGIEKKLIPIKTEEYPLPAKRPKYSVMSNFKFQSTFKYGIRSWHNALKDFLTNDLT